MGRCINRQKTVYSADNIITRALAVNATAHPGQEGGEKRTGIASDFVLDALFTFHSKSKGRKYNEEENRIGSGNDFFAFLVQCGFWRNNRG